MPLEEKTLSVKPRTLFSTSNVGFPIHDEYQDLFIMLYNRQFPLEVGKLVRMEGQFWIEDGYNAVVASRSVGFYRVKEVELSPKSSEYDKNTLIAQVNVRLERVGGIDYHTDEDFLVIPKDGCY